MINEEARRTTLRGRARLSDAVRSEEEMNQIINSLMMEQRFPFFFFFFSIFFFKQ